MIPGLTYSGNFTSRDIGNETLLLFKGDGTLFIPTPVVHGRLLIAGQGGQGGGSNGHLHDGQELKVGSTGGCGAQVITLNDFFLSPGTYQITIGNKVASTNWSFAQAGANTTAFGLTAHGGERGLNNWQVRGWSSLPDGLTTNQVRTGAIGLDFAAGGKLYGEGNNGWQKVPGIAIGASYDCRSCDGKVGITSNIEGTNKNYGSSGGGGSPQRSNSLNRYGGYGGGTDGGDATGFLAGTGSPHRNWSNGEHRDSHPAPDQYGSGSGGEPGWGDGGVSMAPRANQGIVILRFTPTDGSVLLSLG